MVVWPQDGKISQLRTAAMKCLAQILKASEGGSLLASETREAADRRLQEMMAGEKNSVVKAEVAKTAKMISKLDT